MRLSTTSSGKVLVSYQDLCRITKPVFAGIMSAQTMEPNAWIVPMSQE